MATSKALPLWSEGAPGIASAAPAQVPTITPYPVESERTPGAIVVLPGGGYGNLADHEGGPVAEYLNSRGVAGFVCHYRVAPYRHPHPSLDAWRAIRWVRHHAGEYGVDPHKVGVLGFSAGGHLGSYVATHEPPPTPDRHDAIDAHAGRPDCAVLCYPAIALHGWGHEGSGRNLLGQAPDEAQQAHFSNDRHVDATTPPCFLWHTADDPGVPVENSLHFALACKAAGVPCAVHSFPHGPHGIGLAKGHGLAEQWPDLCARWLESLGWTG